MSQYCVANCFPSGVGSEKAISSLVRGLPYMKVLLKRKQKAPEGEDIRLLASRKLQPYSFWKCVAYAKIASIKDFIEHYAMIFILQCMPTIMAIYINTRMLLSNLEQLFCFSNKPNQYIFCASFTNTIKIDNPLKIASKI